MTIDDRLINIYCITNQITGKQYIGQTVQVIEKRFNEHRTGINRYNSYIHNAIKKHGKENFDCSLLEIVDRAVACERESFYVLSYDTLNPNGYNLAMPIHHPRNKGRMSEENRLIAADCMRKWRKIYPSALGTERSRAAAKKNSICGMLATCKKVRVFESDAIYKDFDSYSEASRFYQIPANTIPVCFAQSGGRYKKRDLYFMKIKDNNSIQENL